MATKKITATIATILAQKVLKNLQVKTQKLGKEYEKKLTDSKEYKALVKLKKESEALNKKYHAQRDKFEESAQTEYIRVDVWHDLDMRVAAKNNLSVESIRDIILLDDFFADDTTTQDELVKSITEKLELEVM